MLISLTIFQVHQSTTDRAPRKQIFMGHNCLSVSTALKLILAAYNRGGLCYGLGASLARSRVHGTNLIRRESSGVAVAIAL